uniref:CCHC-type domain-containing protein n=1 Tax=Chromera velia CCMP2878 TaxID=1169474 RepID=A0A0G4HMU3_9ALVE|eukprot:Cvel_29280.t1-p1 / transcript=Cvel_29280.t1 / gene=Cvel_29280 / organism=Chromera_velia_CCMP2878 / gene_product=hypothetical protein / transcript_product=hypothetical protein / location=Cvel_scaffold3977:2269-2781(+) / protein_length=171 / sequence_SO=supercontig / SO=protein_coding / is_pseudo=false
MAHELKRVSINLQTHEFSDVGNAINWNSLLFIVKLKQDAITMHRQLKDLTKEVDKFKDIVAGLKARSKDRGGYDRDGFAIPKPIRCYDCNTLGHLSPNCLNACKVCQQIKRLTGSTTLNVLHSPEDCPKKATDPDTWAALQAQVLKGSRGGGGGPYGGRRQGGGRGGKSRW